MIELEQSAKPLAAGDFATRIVVRNVPLPEFVVAPLVRALRLIMDYEFSDRFVQMALAENDHLAQAFGLYGQHESFGEGIQIWALRRQAHGLGAAVLEHLANSLRVDRVAVHDEALDVA